MYIIEITFSNIKKIFEGEYNKVKIEETPWYNIKHINDVELEFISSYIVNYTIVLITDNKDINAITKEININKNKNKIIELIKKRIEETQLHMRIQLIDLENI